MRYLGDVVWLFMECAVRPDGLLWSRAAGRRLAALAGFLDRRTGHVTEGAEHAAVARIRAQERAAAGALVEELAGVGRHRLRRLMAAVGACKSGLRLHPLYRMPLSTMGSR